MTFPRIREEVFLPPAAPLEMPLQDLEPEPASWLPFWRLLVRQIRAAYR